MAYPIPREFKERVRRLPGAGVLDSDSSRRVVSQVIHVPIAAASLAPVRRPERFVIFGQGRSGSTLLVDLLDSHRDLYCDEELLHHTMRWPEAYVDGKSLFSRARVYGYKVKPSQIVEQQGKEVRTFIEAQVAQGWRVLHLQRSSVCRQTMSGLVARERQSYHRTDEQEKRSVVLPVDIFFDRLEGRLRYSEIEADALEGVEALVVNYDRDLARSDGHEATASRVFEWLELPPHRVESRLRRVSNADWRTDVDNADQILEEAATRGHLHRFSSEGLC